jgi:hypothetical protein
MEMGDAEMIGLDASLVEFGTGAQVEDRSDPEPTQLLELVGVHAMECIGAEQCSPSNGLSCSTSVPTEIPEVEGSAEVDLSIGMVCGCVVKRFGHTVEARGEDGVHRKPLPIVDWVGDHDRAASRERGVFAVMTW